MERQRWDERDRPGAGSGGAGSGRSSGAPIPEPPAEIPTDPSRRGQGRVRDPYSVAPRTRVGCPDRRSDRGDRDFPALAGHPGTGPQRCELPDLRRELDHHRHLAQCSSVLELFQVTVSSRCSHWPWPCRWRWDRDIPHPVRAAAGPVRWLPGGSAGRGALDHLRRLGPLRPGPVLKPFRLGLNEHLGGCSCSPPERVGGRWRHHLHRGHRAGGDDPADHHRRHPRGVRPDPEGSDRGRAGAGATRWEVVGPPCCRSGCPDMSAARCSGLGRALGRPSPC